MKFLAPIFVTCFATCVSAGWGESKCKIEMARVRITNNCPGCSYYIQWAVAKDKNETYEFEVAAEGKGMLQTNRIFGFKRNIEDISKNVHINICLNDEAKGFNSFQECAEDYRKFLAQMLATRRRSLKETAFFSRFLRFFKKRGLKKAGYKADIAGKLTKTWTKRLTNILKKNGLQILEIGVMVAGIVQFAQYMSISKEDAARIDVEEKAQKLLNEAMIKWMGKEVELQSGSFDLVCDGTKRSAQSKAGKVIFDYQCSC